MFKIEQTYFKILQSLTIFQHHAWSRLTETEKEFYKKYKKLTL